MGSLIGLKNMIIFSVILLTIGSVSVQEAFAGANFQCFSNQGGNWNNSTIWNTCNNAFPGSDADATIGNGHDVIITGDEQIEVLAISNSGTLFIECDASLLVRGAGIFGTITNHGNLTASPGDLNLFDKNLFNSGTVSGVVLNEGGNIVPISTKCTQPIGGTVGSMSTTSLLVAGAQANMGLWIIALVGAVAVVGIAYKAKTNKDQKEE